MKRNKIIISCLSILSILSLACGIIGFLQSKKNNEGLPKEEYKVKYIYYVDEVEVADIPKNVLVSTSTMPVQNYVFDRANCTNNVVGSWNEALWKFEPVLTANATCKLYFNKGSYKLTFEIEYGELRNPNGSIMSEADKAKDITVGREKNKVIKIEPDEGYKLASVECTPENDTNWDKENKELTIKTVKEDTKCNVKFEISKYEIELKVSNGSGATTLNSEHGKEINATVSPTTGYGNGTVTCTNNQVATWADNKFNIKKITSDTSCTVEFKLAAYEITVNVTGGTSTPSKNSVNYNGSKEFVIKANEGYTVTGAEVEGCSNGTIRTIDGNATLTVSEVKNNTTCNVILQTETSSSSSNND